MLWALQLKHTYKTPKQDYIKTTVATQLKYTELGHDSLFVMLVMPHCSSTCLLIIHFNNK